MLRLEGIAEAGGTGRSYTCAGILMGIDEVTTILVGCA